MNAVDTATETLTREVGPLPVWGWGVALVGGVVVGRAVSRQFAGSGSGSGGPAPDGLGSVGGAGASGYVGGAVGLPSAAQYAPDPWVAGYQWNIEWRAAAIARLTATGEYSALAVDGALAAYLDGRPLTTAQAAIIEVALQTIGGPPVPPLLRPPDIPDPTYAPPQTDPPPAQPATPARPEPGPTNAAPFPPRRPEPVVYVPVRGDTWARLDALARVPSGTVKSYNQFLAKPGQTIPREPIPGTPVLIPPN